MISAFRLHVRSDDADIRVIERMNPSAPLSEAIWIDLWQPKAEEVEQVAALGIRVPTLTSMSNIELSRRLYRRGDVDYMAFFVPEPSEQRHTRLTPIACIVSPQRLVTVRHGARRPFHDFFDREAQGGISGQSPDELLLHLIDAIVGTLGERLEDDGHELNEITTGVFRTGGPDVGQMLQLSLETCGRLGENVAKTRESLLMVSRVLSHLEQRLERPGMDPGLKVFWTVQQRDVVAMAEHADHLSERVSFATDATLGMINLDQNKSINALSAVAALFLPATLIASVYGMNFQEMPGLDDRLGFLKAVGVMLGSAAVGIAVLKWRKWL
ncbi:MAG: CorA family divalent cation transporter [Pseudomonadota bacterium]